METIQEIKYYWSKGDSPEVDKWFFMENPKLIMSVILSYLIIVLKVGPAFMKDRKPMNLKNVIIGYNFLQIMFSLFLIYKTAQVNFPLMSLFGPECEKNTPENRYKITVAFWWIIMSKMIELLDTVFFVLRKSERQISFLHVYHHSAVLICTWLVLKYAPDYQGPATGLVNSSVHVIMYFYYMVAAMGPKYKRFIWWKKYITLIQLAQFVLLLTYYITLIVKKCEIRVLGTTLLTVNMVLLIFLFGNFYIKSYNSKKETPKILANGKHKMNGSPKNH